MSPRPPASSHLCSTQILWGSTSFYCVTSIGGGGTQVPHRSWKHQCFLSLSVQQAVDMLLALFSGRWCLRLGGLCCDVGHVTPASCPFAAAPQVTLGPPIPKPDGSASPQFGDLPFPSHKARVMGFTDAASVPCTQGLQYKDCLLCRINRGLGHSFQSHLTTNGPLHIGHQCWQRGLEVPRGKDGAGIWSWRH